MILNVDTVLFSEAIEDVTSDPDLVSTGLGAFAKDLEFPLTLGHFSIDAFMVDASIEADFKMLFDNLTGHVTDVFVTNACVVRSLWGWITVFWETERASVLIEEIFLLITKPSLGIVDDSRAIIGGMRRAISIVNFAHDEDAIFTSAIWIDSHWFQDAVRAAARSLLGRAAIKTPVRKFFELRKASEVLELSLATQIADWLIAVQPDVFEFVFGHGCNV